MANGNTPYEGRIEVRHHGIWGTVCDDDFSNAAATVICRSLGFGGRALAKKDGYFGPGEGPIWLDEVSSSRLKNNSSLTICVFHIYVLWNVLWSKIERNFIYTSHSCGLCSVLIKSEFIFRTKVFCYGNETQLNRCEHNHWGEHNCNHEEDAGVICTPGDVNDSKVNRNIPSRWRDSLIVS